ncbi:unnamed protein product, partial [Didymodactylos carnosus]
MMLIYIADISSSIVVYNNNTISLYNAEKMASTIVEQFFDEIKTYDDGTKSAKCLIGRTIVKQSTTSTYNYGRHVQRKHTKEMDKCKIALETKKSDTSKKQPMIRRSFGQPVNQKYGPHNLRQLELTQMIVQDLIIDLGLPLSIVDHPSFLRAMNTIDPRFSVLSRRVLCRETLPSALEQVMVKVKQACSLHTGDNLRRQLEDAAATFNIEEKVVRIVTDNASNNLKAFEQLVIPGFEVYFEAEDDEDEHDDETDAADCERNDEQNHVNDEEERLCMPCFCYTLQLTVGGGLKECDNAKPALAKVAAIAKL